MKLWGGRFSKDTHHLVEGFNASIRFDRILYEVDILGSLAHVKMLEQCNILNASETKTISDGLRKIKGKIEKKELHFSMSDEDIHMNMERLLFDEIGEVAGKLHTGRSRNDQVALDLHLYLRQEVLALIQKIVVLQGVLFVQAKDHVDTLLPGYTHLQRALPVRLAHHLLAYFWMLERDVARLQSSWKRINTMPLGAGALAGSGYNTDRKYVAELLGFDAVYENSMDAVSDRDFIIEFLSDASIIMMHVSRLSEELILWNSREFNFIQLDDAFCTGSSMMPQKKNPDVAELARGKTGRVYGSLFGILTMLKGIPLAYNKDMQEDKEGLFDTIKTLHDVLSVYAPMMESAHFNKEAMLDAVKNDFLNATELTRYLVEKGVPFREAHQLVGKIVLHCIEKEELLLTLPIEEYKVFSNLIDESVYKALDPERVVEAYQVEGGTGKSAVIQQLEKANVVLMNEQAWIEGNLSKIKVEL